MGECGKNGFFGKLPAYFRQLQAMEIPIHASHACYFIMLSVFPTLTLVLGLLRYTALEAADLMDLASGLLPDALEPHIWKLIAGTYAHTSRMVISLSAVTALWSAGRGIYGLMNGLGGVYGVKENRGWLWSRLMCALYTFLFILVLLLTLVLHVFGGTISRWIRAVGDPRFFWWLEVADLRYFLLVAVQTLLFCAMFMYLPGRRSSFRESLPGALFGSLGWTVLSVGFSFYVENFSDYTNIYGSVYAVALAMLWLYLCVTILFYGGALNRFLKDKDYF